MVFENELRILQRMLEKCHIKNAVISPEDKIDAEYFKDVKNLFEKKYKGETFLDFFPQINSNTVYHISDMFLCRYIFLRLPVSDVRCLFLIGPYLNTDITNEQILERAEKIGINPKKQKELELFYTALPVIKQESVILAMVSAFAECIWGGADNFESQSIDFEKSAAFISPELRFGSDSQEEIMSVQAMESRYGYENELIEAVSQGNLHKAELMMSNFSSLAFESRTPDRLRNIKNYCIIMNTLLRKAAEKGGVHPVYLDKVSSDFAVRLENINSLSVTNDFMTEILRTYCYLVKRHSIKKYSPLVQKAIIRIENDLTCDLSLNAMAKLANVSPSYFSDLFKKETGRTLTEYVNGRRMALAKHLLKTTNLQIQTVAQHCGILDLHYFCRMFKVFTGKTPSEYRNGSMVD